MKIWIQSESDFDNEVTDVTLCIQEGEIVTYCWVRGFDDTEWDQAKRFAEELAVILRCPYLGQVA